jgi:hypothetical protein
MGQELINIFKIAEKYGKINGRIRLATLTTISSYKASRLPDTPELVSKFLNALKQVEKEYKDEDISIDNNISKIEKKITDFNFKDLTKTNADFKTLFGFEKEFFMEKTLGYTFPYFYCSN